MYNEKQKKPTVSRTITAPSPRSVRQLVGDNHPTAVIQRWNTAFRPSFWYQDRMLQPPSDNPESIHFTQFPEFTDIASLVNPRGGIGGAMAVFKFLVDPMIFPGQIQVFNVQNGLDLAVHYFCFLPGGVSNPNAVSPYEQLLYLEKVNVVRILTLLSADLELERPTLAMITRDNRANYSGIVSRGQEETKEVSRDKMQERLWYRRGEYGIVPTDIPSNEVYHEMTTGKQRDIYADTLNSFALRGERLTEDELTRLKRFANKATKKYIAGCHGKKI